MRKCTCMRLDCAVIQVSYTQSLILDSRIFPLFNYASRKFRCSSNMWCFPLKHNLSAICCYCFPTVCDLWECIASFSSLCLLWFSLVFPSPYPVFFTDVIQLKAPGMGPDSAEHLEILEELGPRTASAPLQSIPHTCTQGKEYEGKDRCVFALHT